MSLPRYVWMPIFVGCLLIASSAMTATIHRSFAGGYPQSVTDTRVRATEQRAKPNIDHRRVPNLQCCFKRKGCAVPVTQNGADYRPGDIVTSLVGGRLPHIMIVSDKKNAAGVPLVIHNIGSGAKEEDGLFDYPLTGHYRL